jgi:serine protease Do
MGVTAHGATSTSKKTAFAKVEHDPSTQQAISAARGLSKAFRTVSNQLLPSVVAIETRPDATWATADNETDFGVQPNPFKGTPFEEMFRGRQFQMRPDSRRPMPQAGLGSGVIISDSGVILTNNHVVASGGNVTVRLHDGREFQATNVWTDPKTDIAVVKIEGATELVAAKLGNSDDVEIGDWVLALGQPFGLESTVTAGIISAKHRGIGITDRENFLQTDAAINPGNSGGPLVNLDGKIVGINTAISSRSGGNDGIGFAVPANLAKWVSTQLMNDGIVRRAYLGVGIQPITQVLAEHLNVKPREGVVVTDVFPNTPAANTGLQTGDIIVEFAGKPVSSPQALQLVVERAEFGTTHPLKIVRDGKPLTLAFTPEEQPSDFGVRNSAKALTSSRPTSRLANLGLEVSALTTDVARQLGMEGVEGIVVTAVRSDSPAAAAGLESGMVITQVNRQPVRSVDDLRTAVKADDGKDLLLLVKSAQGSRFVVINP